VNIVNGYEIDDPDWISDRGRNFSSLQYLDRPLRGKAAED
jgi:hypothetical protein